MKTKECIVYCLAIVAVAVLLAATVVYVGVRDLTEAIAQPGIQDRIELSGVTITTEEGSVIKLDDVDIVVNSRLIDFFLGAAAADATRR